MSVEHFEPISIGWETTLACNMQCRHCGSDAGAKRPRELDTAQALQLIEMFDVFPRAHLTLTGGETLVRRDWPELLTAVIRRRGAAGLVSNGWTIDRDVAHQLKAIEGADGKLNVALSLDGPAPIHDRIRRQGSYDRVLAAAENLKATGLSFSFITTIHRENLDHLEHVRELVDRLGPYGWQLQVTSNYGRAAATGNLVLDRPLYRRMVETIAGYGKRYLHSPINVYAADCTGYMGPLEQYLRNRAWHGCHAGIRNMGVQSNGDVKGCLSLLDDCFVEGNAFERPLREIWDSPDTFSYNRAFEIEMLSGPCARCKWGYACRAGCHSTSHSILGHMNEAPYCSTAIDQGWYDEDRQRKKAAAASSAACVAS